MDESSQNLTALICNATQPAPIEWVDKMLGCFSLLCLVVGTPLNLISFLFFLKQKRTPTFIVYSVIALTDAWICFNGFPHALLMLAQRQPLLFSNYTFRQVWGLSWSPLPYFSVFLVLMMSVLRAVKVTQPFRPDLHHVLLIVLTYLACLVAHFSAGLLFFGSYEMRGERRSGQGCEYPHEAYPFIHISDAAYTSVELYLAVMLLAAPVVPINISAGVTLAAISKSRRNPASTSHVRELKTRATVTVLLLIAVYTTCNVPVLLCILRYTIFKLSEWSLDILGDEVTVFRSRYMWPLSYVTLVQLNSLVNPLLYFTRMRSFRREVVKGCGVLVKGCRGLCRGTMVAPQEQS